jgi:DNA-directed RNA polymerase subunit RPC12/RpoP
MEKKRSRSRPAPSGSKCPECSGLEVVRTRDKWWHRIYALFGLHVYRCKDCGNRFSGV